MSGGLGRSQENAYLAEDPIDLADLGIHPINSRYFYCTPAMRNARCSRSVAACNAMMACL